MERIISSAILMSLGACLYLGLAGCSNVTAGVSSISSGTIPVPDHLILVAGNNQTVTAGSLLPVDPKVQVVTQSGEPVAGVVLDFNVISGGGGVSSVSVMTDAFGYASTSFILGAVTGVQGLMVSASSVELPGTPSTLQFIENASTPFIKALSFSGIFSDYVNVSQNFSYSAGATLTVEAWILLNSLPTGTGMIFNMNMSLGNFVQLYIDSSGRANIFLPGVGNCVNGSSGYTVTVSPLSVGTKHHIALQYDGTNAATFYDGINVRSSPLATGGCNATPTIQIGRGFPGIIDELRVSNSPRYPAAGFTPSLLPFTPDAQTVLLFHFDGLGVSGAPDYSSPAATFNLLGALSYVSSPFP